MLFSHRLVLFLQLLLMETTLCDGRRRLRGWMMALELLEVGHGVPSVGKMARGGGLVAAAAT